MDGFKFYILSRGENAGRPSFGPNPNCFVVWTNTQDDCYRIYFACKALFVGRRFYPYLTGSVIQLLRKGDVTRLLRTALKNSEETPDEGIAKPRVALVNAEQLKEEQQKNTKMLNLLQETLLHRTFIQPNPNF